MFRRSKTESDATSTAPSTSSTAPEGTEATGGRKGRPTPTRKEAEAAARARAKAPRTRKELAARQRQQRSEQSRTVRQAMKEGDERYYMPRDQGPVKRFLRDYVDSRFSFLEIMIPVMVLTLVFGYSGVPTLVRVGNLVLLGMFMLIVVDIVMLRMRVRRELARRFPDAPMKGVTFYTVTRSMQMKFMRLPKPQVRIGERLPERYR